ncbi:unnamed protein product, partial [Iphiclides podalirius]
MTLTLYQVKLSPPVCSVLMVIEAANIPDVKCIDVDFPNGDHPTEDYLKPPVFFRGAKSIKPEVLEKIKVACALSEKFLTGPWMAGEEIILADICCISSISSLNEIPPIDEKCKQPHCLVQSL